MRITLEVLKNLKRRQRKFAMLTAYDYPMAAAAQAAGVASLLVGDSMGNVVLGQANTRGVPLDLMVPLAEAVRRGAPDIFLVGDVPFECMAGEGEGVFRAVDGFVGKAGCDAIKIESERRHAPLVRRLRAAGVCVVTHLGLRPQSVLSPDGYRAQARDEAEIAALVEATRELVEAGASIVLLEAVPNEASAAVVRAVDVPVIGCGAGPACDGHVVVSHDMLGYGAPRPPRFVPLLADLRGVIEDAMRRYVHSIEAGEYPGPEHAYSMRRVSSPSVQ